MPGSIFGNDSSDDEGDMSSPQSTTLSISTNGTSNISTGPSSPCSPSILLNPIVPVASTSSSSAPKNRKRGLSLVAHVASMPPLHWLEENPDHPEAIAALAQVNSSSTSPPWAAVDLPQSRSSSANPPSSRGGAATVAASAGRGDTDQQRLSTSPCSPDRKCTFAPLPPGRRAYRSNSLSIGVAARAHMISGQGNQAAQGQIRYAGPQNWGQSGGMQPPDVYTYKDVQKGLTKLWGKVRRRASSNASEAQSMEAESKGKSKEIEHIEEASDEEEEPFDDSDIEEDERDNDREDRGRGRSLGLKLGKGRESDDSSTTSDSPHTPPTHGEAFQQPSRKGKEKEQVGGAPLRRGVTA